MLVKLLKVLIFSFVFQSFAYAICELQIRFQNNSMIAVVIDNYFFNEKSRSLTITNLQGGVHNIDVYKVTIRSNANSYYEKLELAYRGTINLLDNHINIAEVDLNNRIRIIATQPIYISEPIPPTQNYDGPQFLTPEGFNALLQTIEETSFDSKKLEIAKFAAKNNLLTSQQVYEITKLFEFDSNRLEFAKFAYQYVYDKGAYFVVANAFELESNKSELFKYIGLKK